MNYAYPEPWAVSDQLRPEIERLGLAGNVDQLREEGYTIVDDGYDPDFCAKVREKLLASANRERGNYFNLKPKDGVSTYHLLGEDDCFTEALLNPKLLALAEYLCGSDFLLSQLSGSVRYEGASAMDLHLDSQWIPPTAYNPMFTACLALDDLSEEAGATRVIPKTHTLMRNPSPDEAAQCEKGVAMAGKVGSFSLWTAYAWHANFARTIPGERVLLHMTFCRLAYRPVEDYANIKDDYLAKWPPVIATMLGRNAWMGLAGRNGGRCDMSHYERMWQAART